MKIHAPVLDYTIKNIIEYRDLAWPESKDFLYLTEIPVLFEADFVKPDYYCFGMITQGHLEINIDNTLHNLSSNSLLIYRPGQSWKVSRVSEGAIGSFVLFNKKFLDSLNENIFSVQKHSFLSQGIQTLIELNAADQLKISSLFNEIFAILHHLPKYHWEPVARNLTSALIYGTDDILRSYIDPDQVITHKDEELLSRFNHLLDGYFKTNRKPEFYASQLCITPNYLYTVLKKKSGQTPTDLINNKVINEARYQVSYTLNSIVEIARNLNFSDQFTFSKYFKKSTGYSPLHYRARTDFLAKPQEN